MQVENDIMKILLDSSESKKILAEFDQLMFKHWDHVKKAGKKEMWHELPALTDLLNTIKLHQQNRSAITNRKLTEFT